MKDPTFARVVLDNARNFRDNVHIPIRSALQEEAARFGRSRTASTRSRGSQRSQSDRSQSRETTHVSDSDPEGVQRRSASLKRGRSASRDPRPSPPKRRMQSQSGSSQGSPSRAHDTQARERTVDHDRTPVASSKSAGKQKAPAVATDPTANEPPRLNPTAQQDQDRHKSWEQHNARRIWRDLNEGPVIPHTAGASSSRSQAAPTPGEPSALAARTVDPPQPDFPTAEDSDADFIQHYRCDKDERAALKLARIQSLQPGPRDTQEETPDAVRARIVLRRKAVAAAAPQLLAPFARLPHASNGSSDRGHPPSSSVPPSGRGTPSSEVFQDDIGPVVGGETFSFPSRLPPEVQRYILSLHLPLEAHIDIEIALMVDKPNDLNAMQTRLLTVPALNWDSMKAKVIAYLMWRHSQEKK